MSDIVFTIINRIDRRTVTNNTELAVVNQYNGALNEAEMIKYEGLTVEEKAAFLELNDRLTFLLESDVFIFEVGVSGSSFTLEDSYQRTGVDTSTMTEVAAGTPLLLVFEFPGFGSNTIKTISLWYDQAFLPADLDDLENDYDVVLTGDGKAFTVTTTREVKVSLAKPVSVTEIYAINFKGQILNGTV